jgi:thioredoxin-like negative regulator of GroEL
MGGDLMSGEAAWADNGATANVSGGAFTTALSEGDLALTARLSRQSLDLTPGDPDLLRLLLVTQLGLRDVDGAQETADTLSAAPLSSDTLDALISARLAAGRIAMARDLVARAVAQGGVPEWALEAARARIALHQNDLSAARAILVRGIERTPGAASLRTLMLEVLMAGGNAAHAREVTTRLGAPPTAPGPEVARSRQGPSSRAADSRG